MYLDAYFDAAAAMFEGIRTGQRSAIEAAAEAVAQSLAAKGALHVMDTGHMLSHETFIRAGGLMAISPFSFEFCVPREDKRRSLHRTPEEAADVMRRLVALALDESLVRPGDVLVVNSNSGRTANVIELALQCRERRVTTVGIASSAQMAGTAAAHPTGKKLGEVVDHFLDNGAPHGDAAVAVEENERMCPLSGLGATFTFWALQAEAVARLEQRGVRPTIYRSVHLDGEAYIDRQRERFLRDGV